MAKVQAMQAVALLALLALATALPAMAEHPTDPTAGIIAPEVMTLDRGSRKLKASCWNYVGNSAPCQGGTPYCCNSNSNHATCLQADNKYTCTSQKGSGYSYGWCYKKC